MSIHIAIAASKGGTGKTTTAWNLGFGLTMAGARVLLVDCDPQDNLRYIAGAEHARSTVASALEHGTFTPNHIRENMWLLPSGGRRLWQATVASDGLGDLTAPFRHGLRIRPGIRVHLN
jgi:cellulose biosynthesis protein BcsQ